MAGDTWVALDGRDSDSAFGTCWVSDVGPYIGPTPAVMLPRATWLPVGAAEIDFLILAPNPDGRDDHVANFTYGYTYYRQAYAAGPFEDGDPTTLDTTPHLFVLWFSPGIVSFADPATLPSLSVSPLHVSPHGWVTGGLLVVPGATFTFDAVTLSVAPGSHPPRASFRLGYDSDDEV